MRVAVFALLGLAFGSFLTVVIHRMPRRESVVAPRSRCARCGTEVRARDNVPVLSYLLLRGRCRACGDRISPEYPLTELATAALFATAALSIEPLYAAAVVAPFLGIMLAVAVIDARHRIVPNRLMYPALLAYLPVLALGDVVDAGVDLPAALLGLAAYAGPLFLLAMAVPGGMGMGDVKLVALIGLVLGSVGLARVAVAAGTGILLGGLGAIAGVVVLGYGRRHQMPFGPFLAAGGVVGAVAGPHIAGLYLSLLS